MSSKPINSSQPNRRPIGSPQRTTAGAQPQPRPVSPQARPVGAQPQPRPVSPQARPVGAQPQPRPVSPQARPVGAQPQPRPVAPQNSESSDIQLPPEIKKLMSMAAQDGVITEKERQVLIKKAEEAGIDRTTFEFYLEKFEEKVEAKMREKRKASGEDILAEIPENPVEAVEYILGKYREWGSRKNESFEHNLKKALDRIPLPTTLDEAHDMLYAIKKFEETDTDLFFVEYWDKLYSKVIYLFPESRSQLEEFRVKPLTQFRYQVDKDSDAFNIFALPDNVDDAKELLRYIISKEKDSGHGSDYYKMHKRLYEEGVARFGNNEMAPFKISASQKIGRTIKKIFIGIAIGIGIICMVSLAFMDSCTDNVNKLIRGDKVQTEQVQQEYYEEPYDNNQLYSNQGYDNEPYDNNQLYSNQENDNDMGTSDEGGLNQKEIDDIFDELGF